MIVFLYFKFGYTFKVAKNLPQNFIVLSNHNTDFDPLFLGVSFKDSMRFVASEHISRWKHAFKFVNHIFSPIMRPKGTNAASTVKEMLRALRGGENVCMFAEGARSWNGVTAPILPANGKLVKSSKCALVTYKIIGGYFVSPMWSKGGTRKGKIHGEVVNIYSAEQIASMSVSQINEIINHDLYEDAYDTQTKIESKYKGKQLAVKLESMLFKCPVCGAIDALSSHKNIVSCRECNATFTYDEYGYVKGINYRNTKELFSWLKFEAEKDAKSNTAYTCENACMISVSNHSETHVDNGDLSLSRELLKCGDTIIDISEIDDFAMHGRQALVFSTKDNYYEVIVSEEYSALKFYMLFQAYKYGSVCKFNF